MRVVMPLFSFQYFEKACFAFSDARLSIQSFVYPTELADRDIFSKRDHDYMGQSRNALVAESYDLRGYEADASLLLMAFRLSSNYLTPIIKYRLSEDDDLCQRLEDTEMHVRLPGYQYETYSVQDFPLIDTAYITLRHAEHTSARLKNAFFFLYRAFNSIHWIDSFLFHMNALEAIFSNDTKGGATKTICRRVSALVDEPTTWNERTVADLYDVRSRITHGNIEASQDPTDNLRLLENLERLTKLCFRKLIAADAFKCLETIQSRNRFMKQLDEGCINLRVS
jgi:Apea-like HEPN